MNHLERFACAFARAALSVLCLLAPLTAAAERELIASKQVGDATYSLYWEVVDENDFRLNNNNAHFCLTRVEMDIALNGETTTNVVGDDLYICHDGVNMQPCMMFDTEAQMMYVFCLTKTPPVDFNNDGILYSSPMEVAFFAQENVFSSQDMGWFPSFGNMSGGLIRLQHFNYTNNGHRMISVRRADGEWVTGEDAKSTESAYKAFWQEQDLMLVAEDDGRMPPLSEYYAAVEAIAPYAELRIFTQSNGNGEGETKYYLTDGGGLTESVDEAHTFTFGRSNDASLCYSPGWKLDIPFTNPSVSNEGEGSLQLDGYIHQNSQNRPDWEGQVWYKRGDRYAVRATNAIVNVWGANTYWTAVDPDADGLPSAEYALQPDYIWQLEELPPPAFYVDIDETNFPDPNFRNYLLGQTYGRDGRLTDSELADVTTIYVNYRGIESLQGIEHFTALQVLYCSGNQLTSLDLSANTALRELYCYGNQLTSLDLENNTALQRLECYGCPLGALDISACPNLWMLNCNYCQLTTLDITNSRWLTELYCNDNQLTSLDLENNTLLQRLECNGCPLGTLDLSACTDLQMLNCSNCQLTTLDVTNNGSLTELYCGDNQLTELNLENNTALQLLECYGSPLGTLDLSSCPDLWKLYCSNCQLTTLNVTNNGWLTELYCGDNRLTSLDLENNTALQRLECYGCPLESLDLSACPDLQMLNCNNCHLTTLNVSANSSLTELYCGDNQLTELIMGANRRLYMLDCHNNQLTTLDASATNLSELHCYHNQIRDAGMADLIASLPATSGNLYVMMPGDGIEGNVCLPKHVNEANKNGWTVYEYNWEEGWIVIYGNQVSGRGLITSVDQLSSPYSDYDEGPLDALIDKNVNTFWHSDWHNGSVAPGTHYLQVEMPDMTGIDFIQFQYTRRNIASDQTTQWGVYGTHDPDAAKEDCTLLGEFFMPLGSNNETLMSEAFCHQGYPYLRFYSDAQQGSSGQRGYFHIAEFQLYPVVELITEVAQLSSPYNDPEEGSLDALIDGDVDTYWHSTWHDGDVALGSHYLQVEMPDLSGIELIKMQFTRRDTPNNHTVQWSVYGTDDPDASKEDCVKLADLSTPFTSPLEQLESEPFQHENFRYLRFYSEVQEGESEGSNGFFHLAEFQLLPVPGEGTTEPSDPSCLVINEIQVANIDQFVDPSFNYGGWIELYNPSDNSVDLGGLYVSDDPANLTKFQLPADMGKVRPRSFATIWFDHHDVLGGRLYSNAAYKQVDWKLTYEGGTVYLSNSDGTLLASQTYPEAIQRCSYARTTDGGDTWQWTSTPTPGTRNSGSAFAATQLEAPVVDRDACMHTEGFDFNVTIPEGCTLYYTMDGSTPTLDKAMSTTEGVFHVNDDETAIYRFRLYRDGYLPSPVVTRSYIYMDRDYYLPVISVVTDQANLYDDQIGAYTIGSNGISGQGVSYSTNRNRSWERPVNFEYLVPEGNDDGGSFLMALNQECDFEVCGGWSRNLYSPYASFRLKGNKYYLGQNFLPYTFFEDKPYIKSKGIMVRNGGNDGYARIKDAGLHEIVLRSGFYLDCQATQPAHVFVNGQYLMMFNIREPNNKNHAYSNYGIDTDEMDQFELNSVDGYVQKVGDFEALKRWIDLSEELAANPTDDSIYEQICDIVDIDEYCNFMAAGCYSGCSDWFTNSNNIKGYRSRQDGKFHLVFMDQDAGFANDNMLGELINRRHNSDGRYPYTNSSYLIDIFVNMLDYAPFRKKFVDAFCIVDGSVYEPTFSQQVFDDMVERTAPAMAMEGYDYNLRSSASEMVSRIRNNRSSRMANMSSRLGLWNEKNIQFSANVDCASFEINGQPVPRATFDGKLFEPATITAKAPAGYRFTGWKLGDGNVVTDSEQLFDTTADWHYYDQGPLDGEDWTSPDYAATDWTLSDAPFGYGNVGIGGSQDWNQQLDYGSDSSNKRPTYYFRKSFNLDALPAENERYQLDCFVDDGFVVYINGEEFGRHLMDNGTPSYYTYSTAWEGSSAGHESLTLPSGSLRLGENVIAVEVHNTSASSSDIYWTAQLSRQTISAEGGATFDSSELDIAQLSDGATLTATFERLADEELLADIATPIKVNEVSAGNTVFINDHFKKNDWIELYNTTDTDLDAAGLYLSDDLDDPLKYQIPSGTVANTIVPANGHLILWADKLESISQLHTPFKLGNTNGQMALVTSSPEFVANNASYFEAHPALKDFADGLAYGMHAGDESVGRYPDGANAFYRMTVPTIERSNTHHSFDAFLGEDKGIMDLTNATFTLDLAEGWNWVAHPLTDAIAVTAFEGYADRILGQTLEAYYSSSDRQMKGLLKRLTAGSLYKVDMSQAHTYTFNGQLPSKSVPVALHPGWNWIGYTETAPQTLAAALATSKADEGDVIIGLSGFAEYSSTDGWVGSLSSLTPGSGYLYRTSATKAIRFTHAASRIRLRKPQLPDADAHASAVACDRHAYPDVMAVIGRIEDAEGQPVALPLTLAAYADGECRGVSQTIGGRHFLSVHGQGGETLTFKALDETGATYDVSQSMSFTSDVAGSLRQPVAFTLASTPTSIEVAEAAGRAARPIAVYNLSGQRVAADANGLRSGIYVVRLSDGQSRKILVK